MEERFRSEPEVVPIIANRVVHSAWAESAGQVAKFLRSNKFIGNWSGSDGKINDYASSPRKDSAFDGV